MKIITYNINGIRAGINKGLIDWISKENPDVICFQEVKAIKEQIDPELFNSIGYKHHYWHSAEKKGYSGVATFSKKPADKIIVGMKNNKYDSEGRILTTVFGDCAIYNCYFPSGSSGEERHQFKMEFLTDFGSWMKKQKRKFKERIIVGDYNVVHGDLDIHNPQRKDKPSGFRPEERAWMDQWFKKDYVDGFRYIHPDKQEFSWWSYRSGARKNNKGWRIDYISVSQNISEHIKECHQLTKAVHSDHCPVMIKLSLTH